MSTITKQAVQAVADLKAGYTLGHADVAILNELARIALASLEAEAVGEVVLGEFDDCGCHPDARVECIAADGQADWENFKDGTRLYTAPTVPVSVPDAMEMDDDFDSAFEHGKAVGWNAYRAAMLQGAVQPQSAQQNIPEIIPGGLVESVNNLLNNDGSRGRYSAMECGAARERIELWLAQRQKWESQRSENLCAGNSPATPDGYVLVPKEMTPEMMRAVQIKSELGGYAASELSGAYDMFSEFWDVAVSAAPQQEVK